MVLLAEGIVVSIVTVVVVVVTTLVMRLVKGSRCEFNGNVRDFY